jgi:hypothetical protein
VQVKTNLEFLCVFARNLEKQNRQVRKRFLFYIALSGLGYFAPCGTKKLQKMK